MKIIERTRTLVLLGIYILISFFSAFFMKFLSNAWAMSQDIWGFMQFETHLLPIGHIVTLVIAGDIVASEFSWGTVKLLLIRPVRRAKILLSKYVTVVLFGLLCMLLLFICSFLFGAVFFGFSSVGDVFKQTLTTYGEYLIEVIVMATFAFMLSTVSRSSALSIALSIFLLFTGDFIVELVKIFGFDWGKYLLWANLDLSQYDPGGTPEFPGMTRTFSLMVLGGYFVLFYFISWWVYTKRDVSI
jgi:ABC-2 type transport system permease protein